MRCKKHRFVFRLLQALPCGTVFEDWQYFTTLPRGSALEVLGHEEAFV